MTCEETRKAFSPYLDGELNDGARASLETHLRECPVCRAQLDETRAIVRGLALLERPAPPAGLARSVRDALMVERAAYQMGAAPPFGERVTQWLEVHLMPYTVGAFASLVLFVAVLSALRPYLGTLQQLAAADHAYAGVTWVPPGDAGFDVTKPLTPEGFAADRAQFAAESPSLNPRGALARLAWAPSTGGSPDDDDMVVVADVYGNGRASLAAVMEPPRNPRMIDELQEALRKNPAFVPASLDRRPQTMRVVFVLQKMNVGEQSY